WRASASARSASSGCENLKPWAAAGPAIAASTTATRTLDRTWVGRIAGVLLRSRKPPLGRKRLAQCGPEIHWKIRHVRRYRTQPERRCVNFQFVSNSAFDATRLLTL